MVRSQPYEAEDIVGGMCVQTWDRELCERWIEQLSAEY